MKRQNIKHTRALSDGSTRGALFHLVPEPVKTDVVNRKNAKYRHQPQQTHQGHKKKHRQSHHKDRMGEKPLLSSDPKPGNKLELEDEDLAYLHGPQMRLTNGRPPTNRGSPVVANSPRIPSPRQLRQQVNLNDVSVNMMQPNEEGYESHKMDPGTFNQTNTAPHPHTKMRNAQATDDYIHRRQSFATGIHSNHHEMLKEPSSKNLTRNTSKQMSSLVGDMFLDSIDNVPVDNLSPSEINRKKEISVFSSMAQNSYGTLSSPNNQFHYDGQFDSNINSNEKIIKKGISNVSSYVHSQPDQEDHFWQYDNDDDYDPHPIRDSIIIFFSDAIHKFVYDPKNPEFSSLHQFTWAVLLGILMGIFTAVWGIIIENCVDIVWVRVPEKLLHWGIFTDSDGYFPLPHYMWICPAFFGGILSYLSAALPPIPDQNVWIDTLHTVGIVEHDTFLQLFLISTAGMASGLSLGPELPLVITAGMVGSYIGLKTRQSVLSARVMNLTAASAAIGGFFGFPMAGALFVLELPHRMGLQYFEALSPATIASIIAVLVNRIITKDDVKGMFTYPFLSATLPSSIFYIAIVFGLAGSLAGTLYTVYVMKLKTWVHDWFHHHDHNGDHDTSEEPVKGAIRKNMEQLPLVGNKNAKIIVNKLDLKDKFRLFWQNLEKRLTVKHEPSRAACAGTLAGAIVGVICMFLPHLLFWGEAQLQTLIDKGQTPLPFIGEENLPTSSITDYGYCMIDPGDTVSQMEGFSIVCSFAMFVGKIIVVGLSLGTGIVGGQFWGPLFVGCVFAQFFTDFMIMFDKNFQSGMALAEFPCVSILCIMGATHVVTFRAHTAIMLILTLTISSFAPSNKIGFDFVGGDYSAIFPLLVVSCFVSLMLTRSVVFYKKQRSRGDIIASPEVLCEPRKEGTPDFPVHSYYSSDDECSSSGSSNSNPSFESDDDYESSSSSLFQAKNVSSSPSQKDIEKRFNKMQYRTNNVEKTDVLQLSKSLPSQSFDKDSNRLDELLCEPIEYKENRNSSLQRATSDIPEVNLTNSPLPTSSSQSSLGHIRSSCLGKFQSERSVSRERAGSDGLTKVSSFGQITEPQPDLMNQGRLRASSATKSPLPNLRPPRGRHRKSSSRGSYASMSSGLDLESYVDSERESSSEKSISAHEKKNKLERQP